VRQLAKAGIHARVEREELGFEFADFESAWEVLAGVTAAGMTPARREEAKRALRVLMWPEAHRPRRFRNLTQFIVGRA
jgi:hypothetical protein